MFFLVSLTKWNDNLEKIIREWEETVEDLSYFDKYDNDDTVDVEITHEKDKEGDPWRWHQGIDPGYC